MHLVKHLKGHSGAQVSLYTKDNEYFVVKENYAKARQSAAILESLPFPTPHVYELTDDKIVMEYINGQDMASYLESADDEAVEKLIDFLSSYIQWCLDNSEMYSFREEVANKIFHIGHCINLNHCQEELSVEMPRSIIHGDFTLENIMYANDQFYFIDANPTELNSIYFDANKLRQDIDALWFVRNREDKVHHKIVCNKISKRLKKQFDFMRNDTIMILMLARILPYTKDIETEDFLMKEIDKLWL